MSVMFTPGDGTGAAESPHRSRCPDYPGTTESKSASGNSVSCCATPSQAPRGVVVGADTTEVSAPPRKTESCDAPNWTPLATEVSSRTRSKLVV